MNLCRLAKLHSTLAVDWLTLALQTSYLVSSAYGTFLDINKLLCFIIIPDDIRIMVRWCKCKGLGCSQSFYNQIITKLA